LVNLILHQRDQWGDNDGQAGAVQSGDLKTEGLAAPGGKQREDVSAGQGGLDDFALERAKFRVPKGGVKRMEEVGHG
jgi:hypothetical protein